MAAFPMLASTIWKAPRKAVDLLLAEGHRKIAFIGDSRTRLAYSRRRQGL